MNGSVDLRFGGTHCINQVTFQFNSFFFKRSSIDGIFSFLFSLQHTSSLLVRRCLFDDYFEDAKLLVQKFCF
ncbi:hypothetical protein Hanom_Chr06g00567971 [Helianthus anomalus]